MVRVEIGIHQLQDCLITSNQSSARKTIDIIKPGK